LNVGYVPAHFVTRRELDARDTTPAFDPRLFDNADLRPRALHMIEKDGRTMQALQINVRGVEAELFGV